MLLKINHVSKRGPILMWTWAIWPADPSDDRILRQLALWQYFHGTSSCHQESRYIDFPKHRDQARGYFIPSIAGNINQCQSNLAYYG